MPTKLRRSVFGEAGVPKLPESRTIYAVLDAAAIPHLPHYLEGYGSSFSCLFDGAARENYGDAAPYLVEMDRHDRVWDWFESELYGHGCGVLIETSSALPELKRHLKKFVRVTLPDASEAFFKYYLPGNFHSFVPMLEPADLARFFSRIDACFSEQISDRSALLRWTYENGELRSEALAC